MAYIIQVPGILNTSDWFRWRLVNIGYELSIDADFLASIMSVESGFNPAATNKYTNATGLIQFMPETARRLGTTVDALRAMSRENQLEYVKAFYRPFAGRLANVGDTYMATFMPAYVGKPKDFVLFVEGEKGYEQNVGLDRNKDGRITVGDVTETADARYNVGLNKPRIVVPNEEPARPMVGNPNPKAGAGSSGAGSPSSAVPRTISRGAKGDVVARWQAIVGVGVDGWFGSITELATIRWQAEHGLVADGIVGRKTWTEALKHVPSA